VNVLCVSAKKLFVTLVFVFCSWYIVFVMGVKEQIAQARRNANLTQAELAERVGVTTRTVQNWEAGTRGPWRYIAEICIATRTPLTFFFNGENGDNGEAQAA
jgi:transcriptional regulator with XRE-family HTH domain